MKEIDVRGLECPEPAKIVAAEIERERPHALKVVTDSDECRRTLLVMIPLLGYRVAANEGGEGYYVLVFQSEA
ncbi:MAG: sulfurtransferase TusA family protein [Thermoproteus sp. AZ2]|jgi:TusA-related sulfurtransferase|uniref:Sulfurtransferase TusA family protein n=1 Tax=Thermoproteus sp. AZ2 TaxID=1609232 RepID=A0ACC6V062_9CREN